MGAIQTKGEGSGVRPCVRGIGWRVTTRGTLLRFFPACVLGLVAVDVSMGNGPAGAPFLGYSLVAMVFSGIVTLGYWLGLEGMRRWLYPDAAVDGRRSVVAGLMASIGVFLAFVWQLGSNWVGVPLLIPGTGFVLAVAMFLPWLSPSPGMAGAGGESVG